jgi:RNA 2',3'-cyclic 3'-phosphodiesterase
MNLKDLGRLLTINDFFTTQGGCLMSHIFIGIQVPNAIGVTLNDWSEKFRKQIPLKQWTHQEDLHITLAFLGDMKQGDFSQLKEALTKISQTAPSFQLKINGAGFFGNPKTPRVLWAGLQKEAPLFELQKQIYEACIAAGYNLDKRPYRPHITLGKKWGGTEPVAIDLEDTKEQEDNELSWLVKDFVIFEIHPNLSPRYKPIERYLLQ